MNSFSPPALRCPHLLAAVCALAAAAVFLGGVQAFVRWKLPEVLPFYAAHAVPIKINGNLLQTVAFRTPGELPIYGSSELDNWVANRADAFFRHRPTGFAAFTVGRGGGSCLSILQKLAAVGPAARGKRVVIFLSPAWFVETNVDAAGLEADLGISQLGAWMFGDELSPSLKTAIAKRMRNYPEKVKNQDLLDDALRALAAGPAPLDRLGFALLTPLGRFQNALLESLESCAVLWQAAVPQRRWLQEGQRDQPPPPTSSGRIDWSRLGPVIGPQDLLTGEESRGRFRIRDLAGLRRVPSDSASMRDDARSRTFLAGMESTREFDDLALLIRVLKEMRMKAYFIGQPFKGVFRDRMGIGAEARWVYYERLEAILRAGGYPWHDFTEHEDDDAFFADAEHPSAQAWLFYNRAIDRFYSGEND